MIVLLLSAALAATALLSQQLTVLRANKAVPSEGFYWTVAQHQIAHHRLKQELRAIAAGEAPNLQELSRRAAVLASKASILTEPSELTSLLGRVPGYGEAALAVADVQRQITPLLEKPGFASADAVKVLAAFQAMGDEALLSRLANDARLEEIHAKDATLETLSRRLAWAWGGFAVCWAALALWLLSAIRSRRRYKAAARDRQQAVEAMEHAIDAKRRFLSMVNHEVRSPLQSIVTAAELLGHKESQPDRVAAIRRIRHAVTALQGQLRDLTTITQSASDQHATQAETFDFAELVQDVCIDLVEATVVKGLSFEVDCPPSPMVVSADPVRIAQVLRNLVENAVRYTSAGQVQIRVEPFIGHRIGESSQAAPAHADQVADALGDSPVEGMVRFVVSDTGPGLPPAAQARLKSADMPFEASSDGTGIGLSVIRDVLLQLGGRIDVKTRDATHPDGRGSSFTVSIPALQAHDVAPRMLCGEPGESLNVLVVDDRHDVRESLSELVGRLGHTCRASDGAAQARPLLASMPFDVVLIDLEMPDTDGRELGIEIRQGGGLNAQSMLMLISAAENQSAGQVWPFDGFLQKPIDSLTLARVIGSRS